MLIKKQFHDITNTIPLTNLQSVYACYHLAISDGAWKCKKLSQRKDHFGDWCNRLLGQNLCREDPDVKKLYNLLRASNPCSATKRMHSEIIGKDLFKVLREKLGGDFGSFISDKVVAVAGDVSSENLGIKDEKLRKEMLEEIDIVLHSAASTKFDERFDVAMGTNTFGAFNVVNFAKSCTKVEILLYVSTAYVCGETDGLVLEQPFQMGQTLNGFSKLDIDFEKKLVEKKLRELRTQNYKEEAVTSIMRNFGLESTYKEPFPGWVEGVRTIDSFAVAYGKKRITCFPGINKEIVYVMPADMVVNAIIVAMVANANQCYDNIYHVGSSIRNPLRYLNLQDYGYKYFTEKPCMDKDGKLIKVGRITLLDMESFQRYMFIYYFLPLKGLKLINTIFCQRFRKMYLEYNRKIQIAMRLVDLYSPYLFFCGVFDDINMEKLRMAARQGGAEMDSFYFDPKMIDWEDYFINIHVPGIVKYLFK
ncbi:hypothetical protein L6164_026477 [Bauhinia variegata]|uniref:Uncharacterized protein n=1 Tax=Bauhinia variegata TaxID=167791 RepID=A0ACB9LPW2_BAUVA|nr:hypothetical protein L6164_026477 [Bauhinia variegata]